MSEVSVSLLEVAHESLSKSLFLLLAETNLESRIPVVLYCSYLRNCDRTCRKDRRR